MACAGKDYEARRDLAMPMMLLDTGARREEIAAMRLSGVDFELDVVHVHGKGGRQRALPFGRKTAVALDRYLGPGRGARMPTWTCCGLGSSDP